ncbi:MAG: SGNH/GDSL hydrolase family protein [Lachnospiraceae bacterium]|nr:SGNH/GDSL hydrolase family protein [Lachnospiraceae bacterium]
MKTNRLIIHFLICSLLVLSTPVTALAAPKTMPDGAQFDAEFYAATYPDVVAALGKSEKALYGHYVTFGAKEGRLPYAGAKVSAQPQGTQPAVNAAATAAPVSAPKSFLKKWKGRNVSILGDSISTFGGCLPQGYVPHYPQSYMPTSDLTWWMQTIRAGSMNFVADASWSGSRVTGNAGDETGKTGCSTKRAQALFGKEKAPNLIFVMMGTNDFLSDVYPDNFGAAYNVMLDNLKAAHPGAQIVCLTCLPVICTSTATTQQNNLGFTISDYNARIVSSAAAHGIPVCDTNACGISLENWRSYLADGIHPNAQGMALIANYIVNHL